MKDLSFCIQGPVTFNERGDNLTLNLIESIRNHFPDSPIIFSTWLNESVEFVSRVSVIQSVDPGSGPRYVDGTELNNINRQIVSTKAGLSAVETSWCVKVRSDLLFENRNLGTLVARLPETPGDALTIFERYVIVLDRLTFSPRKKANPLLHLTDMMHAGLTSDLRKMWDLPPMSQEQETYFVSVEPDRIAEVRGHIPQFRAEQYFFAQLVSEALGVRLSDTMTQSLQDFIETEDIFASNVVPLRLPTVGVSIQKESYPWSKRDSWISGIYAWTFFDWWKETRSMDVRFRLPISLLFWEVRGEILSRLYRAGSNLPPDAKAQRSR